MAGAFMWDDKVAGGVLSAPLGNVAAGMPLSNVLDPQPRVRARFAGSAASVLVDMGTARGIDCLALMGTTLNSTATARLRVGEYAGLVDPVPVFDLGFTAPASFIAPAGWTFNRATVANFFNAAGDMAEAAVDTLRFTYDRTTLACQGVLLEEARTNAVRNPRAEGATTGAIGGGGVLPTNWTRLNVGPTGLTTTVVAVTTVRGMPVLRLRINGTPASTSTINISPDTTTGITAAPGQTWAWSWYMALQAGSTSNVTFNSRVIARVAGGGLVATGPTQNGTAFTPTAALTRYVQMSTLTADATTARVTCDLQFGVTSGQAVDFTVDIACVQMEIGACESSPILPPVGVPGTSTRAADQTRITGQSIGAATLLVQCQVQGGASGTVVAAGFGPPDSFDNSSYFAVLNGGSCAWAARSGGVDYGPGALSGTANAATILVGASGATGHSFARNAATSVSAVAYSPPAGMDRVSLGGVPWGNSASIGIAQGVGTYQRLALFAFSANTTQVGQLGATGSTAIDPSVVVYDSGTVAAGTSSAANGNVVLLTPSTATGRYLRIDVAQSGAAVIDIGRLVAGPLWRLQYSVPTNAIAEGREILDRRERNPFTGAEFPVPALINPRKTRFTLPLLSKAEVIGQHRDMLAGVGGAGEALWIPETSLSQAELCARAIWGAVQGPGEEALASRENFIGHSRSFAITERV